MIRILTLFALGMLMNTAAAQVPQISTLAGTGNPAIGAETGSALSMNIGQPMGVTVGPDGALYIAELENSRIRRLDLKTGAVSTVAGNGTRGYSGDGGPALSATMAGPVEIRFDNDGNILFAENGNHVIRRVDARTKVISTLAGTGTAGYSGDGGPAGQAQLNAPHSLALDAAGNVYIADVANARIRRVDARTGKIESIAGSNEKALPKEGQVAKDNPLIGPRAVMVDGETLWIALREGHSLWRMNLREGILHHFAGTGQPAYSGDGGPAKAASFNTPKGLFIGPDKNLYLVDAENLCVRKIEMATGIVTTVTGGGPGKSGFEGDGGPAAKALLNRPHGIGIDAQGTIYIGDTGNHRVRQIKVK